MASVKSGRVTLRRMEEEMRVGIRLHKRLLGQNDVLDHELNHKVNRMTKEQKKAFTLLDTDMKYLKRELSKNSIKQRVNGEKCVGRTSGIHEWDKPSSTVLKARMMLHTAKPTKEKKNDYPQGRLLHKLMPKNVIRLEDLPRIRYEEKRRSSTAQPKTSVTENFNEELTELLPPPVLQKRRSSVPVLSLTPFEDREYKQRHYRRFSNKSENEFSIDDFLCEDSYQYPAFRRSSILSDTDVLLKIPYHSERRKSFPNALIDVPMGRRSSSEGKIHYNKNSDDIKEIHGHKFNTPSNAERRVQRKRSVVFQIYKYLADAMPNMSNQAIADIQRQRQKKIEENEYTRFK